MYFNLMALCNALHFAYKCKKVLYSVMFEKEREDNVIIEMFWMLNLIMYVVLNIIFQLVIWTHIARSNCSVVNRVCSNELPITVTRTDEKHPFFLSFLICLPPSYLTEAMREVAQIHTRRLTQSRPQHI